MKNCWFTCLAIFMVSVSLHAQPLILDNGLSQAKQDTTFQESSFEFWSGLNPDTCLLNNLSLWMSTDTGSATKLTVQNTANYNNFSKRWVTGQAGSHLLSVSRPQIRDHQYLYQATSYQAPLGILNWPAKINGESVASFVDINSNGSYEPTMGDYPYIRGDQSILRLNHDGTLVPNSLAPIGVSVAQYTYLFPKSGDPLLDQAVGVRYVIKNQSNNDYDSLSFAIHFHPVFNNLNTNYLGTDVSNNAMFAYSQANSSNFVSVVLLNQELKGSIYFKNEGQTANKNDIPTEDTHFINFLNGKWKDGDTLRLGSTGLDGDSAAQYVFAGTTLPGVSEWSEEKVGNQAGDRHGLLLGRHYSFKRGDFFTLEFALLHSPNLSSFDELYLRHQQLSKVYAFNQFTTQIRQVKNQKQLFQNPVKSNEILRFTEDIASIKVLGINGEVISEQYDIGHQFHVPAQLKTGIYIFQVSYLNKETHQYKVSVL